MEIKEFIVGITDGAPAVGTNYLTAGWLSYVDVKKVEVNNLSLNRLDASGVGGQQADFLHENDPSSLEGKLDFSNTVGYFMEGDKMLVFYQSL